MRNTHRCGARPLPSFRHLPAALAPALFAAALACSHALAEPPAPTGRGAGKYREEVDSPKTPENQCKAEKQEILDQVAALRDLYEVYRKDPAHHQGLLQMIRNEY